LGDYGNPYYPGYLSIEIQLPKSTVLMGCDPRWLAPKGRKSVYAIYDRQCRNEAAKLPKAKKEIVYLADPDVETQGSLFDE